MLNLPECRQVLHLQQRQQMQNLPAFRALCLGPVRPLIRILKATEEEDRGFHLSIHWESSHCWCFEAFGKRIFPDISPEKKDNHEGCESVNSGPCQQGIIWLNCPRSLWPRFWREDEGEGWVIKLLNAALKPQTSKKFFQGGCPTYPQSFKMWSLWTKNPVAHVGRDLPVCLPMYANYQGIIKSTLVQRG